MSAVEAALREHAPRVLGTLVRRHGRFDLCEDAVQEALIAAAAQWTVVPEHPRGWLVTVASRRLIDALRREEARERREDRAVREQATPPDDDALGEDDTLHLLFLCCHPSLSAPSQLALTLRAVAGLSTAEIARAFLVPETTMDRRIMRAKQTIREAGASFKLPPEPERDARLQVVLHALYLLFNEGYAASGGLELQRTDLTREALRLTRTVQSLLPGDGEVRGLLALMLLTDSRRAARTGQEGELVPLAAQDRLRWDGALITEGVALITTALTNGSLGPYQLQAAIAAVHAEAPSSEETDWPQVLGLYVLLDQIAPNPVATLNRALALGMVDGPRAGLGLLDEVATDKRLRRSHRVAAVRAHLLERDGELTAAATAYREAARGATSVPERRFLTRRAARCTQGSAPT